VISIRAGENYVAIHIDGWIELDTEQLDRIAEFDNSARNFHST